MGPFFLLARPPNTRKSKKKRQNESCISLSWIRTISSRTMKEFWVYCYYYHMWRNKQICSKIHGLVALQKGKKKKWVFWVRKTNVFSIMKEFWVHCWYHTRRKTKQNKTKMEQNSWFGWLENQKRTDFFGVGKTAIF